MKISEADEPFWGESVYYDFRCKDCEKEHRVEDIVIDAFLASGEYEKGQMPELACPFCGKGTLIFAGDKR